MPIPFIINVAPSSGPTGGGVLVEILGSGFRVLATGAEVGPVSAAEPPLVVLVGGRAAREVRVLGTDRLTCIVPAGHTGPADVTVQNVDADGVPVPGEQAVAPLSFTYVRPPLTAEADLTRLVRALLQEIKRQVLETVVLTVHTDSDDDTGAELHLAQVARLPALVLIGPELAENRFFSINQQPEVATEPGRFAQRRAPYTVDLGFAVVGVADHTFELLNLMVATQLFFHRNKFLELDRDPHNAEVGSVRYEMDVARDGDLKVTSQPNESNVRSFAGRFVVRGFDLEALAGVPDESVVARGAVTRDVALDVPAPFTPRRPGDVPPER